MLPNEQFNLVLPHQGKKALAQVTDDLNERGDRIVRHHWFDNNEQLAEAAHARRDQPRIYMAMAGYDDARRRKQENALWIRSIYHDLDAGPAKIAKFVAAGKPWQNKVYETQQHALEDLIRVSRMLGMKPSLINSSGMGLHVYWALDRDYTVQEAQPVMLRVKAAFKAIGIKSDPAVPGDTARVLRPVGSLYSTNSDGSEVRVEALKTTGAIYTLAEIDSLIADHVPVNIFAPKVDAGFNINDDILTYPQYDNSMAKGAEQCAALAEVRDAKGQVEEPLWRAMIGLSKACNTDGQALRHEWSSGDPRYDPATVEGYADRWQYGPTRCEQFAEHCDACQACPYAGKISSPIVLCRVSVPVEPLPEVPEPAPVHEPIPDDATVEAEDDNFSIASLKAARPELFQEPTKVGQFFFKETENTWRLYARVIEESRGADGEIARATVNKHIASRLFWYESCTAADPEDEQGSQLELVIVSSPKSAKRVRCHISASVMADGTSFAKKLLERGIVFSPEPSAANHTKRYMIMEHNRVQNDLKYAVRNRFGYDWHTQNGQDEFICAYGDLIVRAVKGSDGTNSAQIERTVMHPALGLASKHLLAGCLPPSERGAWGKDTLRSHIIPEARRYAEFVNRYYGGEGHEAQRLALLIGLASSYMVFTDPAALVPGSKLPANGGVVSLYSKDGGKGKTALQKLIGAAYGAGVSLVGGDKQGATQHSRSSLAVQLGIFPLLLDEVSQNDPKRQASEVQQFANGSGRMRATRSGGLAQAGNWSLITVMSTNASVVDAVKSANENTEAVLPRIIEFDFDNAPSANANDKSYEGSFGDISLKGGAIGLLLTYTAVALGRDRMVKLCQAEYARVFREYQMDQALRFYGRMFAAALVTNTILGKYGVRMFSEDELAQGFRKLAEGLVDTLKFGKKTVHDSMADMLDAMSRNIAVTHRYPQRGVHGDTARHCALVNDRLFQLPIKGRQVTEDGLVMIRAKDMASWCAENRLPLRKFLDTLQATNSLVRTSEGDISHRKSLTLGIPGIPEQPRCSVYIIDTKKRGSLSVAGGRTMRAEFADDTFLPDDAAVNE